MANTWRRAAGWTRSAAAPRTPNISLLIQQRLPSMYVIIVSSPSRTDPQPCRWAVNFPPRVVVLRMPMTRSAPMPTPSAHTSTTGCGEAELIQTSKPAFRSVAIRSFCWS